MSGIEAASFVLGALPILLSVIDSYKDVYQRGKVFFTPRRTIEKLANSILMLKLELLETVRRLLLESGCEDMPDLDSNPLSCLHSESVRENVQDYLGEERNDAFTRTLLQTDEAVRSVARSIAGLVPAIKGPPDNLQEIIRSNEHAEWRRRDMIPRVKLAFRKKDFEAAIKELNDSTDELHRFVSHFCENNRLAGASASRKASRLAKALRNVRSSAADLYQAIFHCWQAECHDSHEATLFLEDRVETATSLFQPVRRGGGPQPSLVFQLFLVATSGDGHTLWHEAPVKVLRVDDDSTSPAPLSLAIPAAANPRVRIVTTAVNPPAPTESGMILIKDICTVISNASRHRRHIALVLGRNRQMGMTMVESQTAMLNQQVDRMTLGAILSDHQSRSPSGRLTLRLRMLLALRLASNLLQLSKTQWLGRPWSKDAVYFLRRPPGSEDGRASAKTNPAIDFKRPFVSVAFSGHGRTVACGAPAPSSKPKEALLELGILLLEIWHEETLEDHFNLEQAPVEYWERMKLGMVWLDDESDPIVEKYHKAVFYCVAGMNGGENRGATWEADGFWNGVCEEVIQPLFENCKQWR